MNAPADFPRLLAMFFGSHLMQQRQASPHIIASYRDTFRLLVHYAQRELKKPPSELALEDLDSAFIGDFLSHLENERGNHARSRNTRLAAIRSFFRHVALHEPQHAALAQRVLAMPSNAISARPWPGSTGTRSKPCSELRTRRPGSAAATGPCSRWRCKPGCGRRNWSDCVAAT